MLENVIYVIKIYVTIVFLKKNIILVIIEQYFVSNVAILEINIYR